MDLQILAAQITGIEAKLTRLREQAAADALRLRGRRKR